MKLIDLHIHTTASDGSLTPEQAVAHAAEKQLAAIAITDHDTAEGAAEAVGYAEKYGVKVVPGIEISTDYRRLGVHILGYFIDPHSPALEPVLDWIVRDRKRRNHEIIELMRRDGIDISAEMLAEKYPHSVVGRPHFAAFLVEKGLASSVKDGFDRYLDRGKPYFRPRTFLPVEDAIKAITGAGGKAVFAHPLQYKLRQDELLKLAIYLRDCGVVGMECLYSGYSPEDEEFLMKIAKSFRMCVTGGSDFHGAGKPQIEMGSGKGSLRVPYGLLEGLRAK